MKRVVGLSIRCLFTLALTLGILYKLDTIVRPTSTDSAFDTINAFHDMPENTLEVIGYGSSHMWRGLSAMSMYEKYGIGAYNYGCNWQRINTTALFIQDSLRTQSPKVALIETYHVDKVLQDTNMNGEIYYSRAIRDFEGKREYLRQCFGNNRDRYLSYYVPFFMYHSLWTDLSEECFQESSNSINFYETMGYYITEEANPTTIPDPSGFEQKKISKPAISVLDEIVDACNEKTVKIIFYTAPYHGEFAYGDAMKAYAQEKGCVYLNLFEYVDEIGLDGETDFFDGGHLNNSGSVKVAEFLGEYIVNNYDVTDFRTVEGNVWEQYLQ